MAVNPLFTDGYFFFSGMYDDSLLSKFYPKVSAETYTRAIQTQSNMIGREKKSSNSYTHFRGSIKDFVIDDNFNVEAGLPIGTYTIPIENIVLPISDRRRFIRTYGSKRYVLIPMEDLYSKTDIFNKVITIQMGSFRFMKAVLVYEKKRRFEAGGQGQA